MAVERESIDFDVLFVGGGPASLAGAIRLMQLAKEKNLNLEVALIEKGAEIGSHALSGAVMDPIPSKNSFRIMKIKAVPSKPPSEGMNFII